MDKLTWISILWIDSIIRLKSLHKNPLYGKTYNPMSYIYKFLVMFYVKYFYWPLGATTVSLSHSQYSVAESDTSLTMSITMTNATPKDVMVEITISDGSANGKVEQHNSVEIF